MIVKETIMLLKKNPVFRLLDDETLRSIASGAKMEFYQKGQTILQQGGPAAEYLGIIRSGEVKVFTRTNEGEEVVLDQRVDGDFFGFLSLFFGDVSRNTVIAAEDTTCYLIRKETVLSLMRSHPEISEYFLRDFLGKLVDMTYREIHDRTLLYGGGDKLLFTSTVGDLASKKVITASEDSSIRNAAKIMSEHRISSLVLLDAEGLPAGIVTDRDIRDKVVARNRDHEDSVKDIMSISLIKSETRDYCFEALMKMIRYNIHHLLVVAKGELKGIITNHDLMMLQGTSPLSLAREIETQSSIDGLIPVSRRINRVINILVQEGSRARHVTRIITEINDRLLRKILELTEKRLGPPPVGFCWIVLGSEGRKEQTFRTDQDNSLIFDDPEEGAEDEARRYFAEFGLQVIDSLIRCGVPRCSAGYMSDNPKWCQPASVWEGYFAKWIERPTPEAILQSLIFFDFRSVYGDVLLAEKLRAYLGHRLKNQHVFLAHMASAIVANRPPLGFMKRFKVEKSGEHKNRFNIKFNALCPIVDAVRLSSLEAGVYHTSTIERLRELRERDSAVRGLCGDLEEAFEFLMSIRLRHQFEQLTAGAEPDNFVDPQALSTLERRMLRESFRVVTLAQEAVRKQYGAWMGM